MSKFIRKSIIVFLLVALLLSLFLVGCSDEKNATNVFKVTFLDWDGSIIQVNLVSEGGVVSAPKNLVRKDENGHQYKFIGWDKDISVITEDIVVTAVYEDTKVYRIFFMVDDEIFAEYKSGDAFSSPQPQKAGMTFCGWYYDDDSENAVEINYIYFRGITADVYLYAKFLSE